MAVTTIQASPRQIAACESLVYNLLQRCEAREGMNGSAVALVSAHRKAGVSVIVRLLEQMLNENAPDSAIGLDCISLGLESVAKGKENEIAPPPSLQEYQRTSPRYGLRTYRDRIDHLNSLRSNFRYVLIDCHSLKENTELLGLAPLIEGVIIVLEANRTTKGQLRYLERSIEEYGGRILGNVLNKRTYPIPQWINHWMERSGI